MRSMSVETERTEREPDEHVLLAQACDELASRMAPVELVGLIGDDQADPERPSQAEQELDEVPGRRVGEMDILEDEQDHAVAGEPLEPTDQRLDDSPSDLVGRPERRDRATDPCRVKARSETGRDCREVMARRADDPPQVVDSQWGECARECVPEGCERHAGRRLVGSPTGDD